MYHQSYINKPGQYHSSTQGNCVRIKNSIQVNKHLKIVFMAVKCVWLGAGFSNFSWPCVGCGYQGTNHTRSTLLYSQTAPFLVGLKFASRDTIGHQDEPIGKAYLAHEAEVLHFGLEVSHVCDLRSVLAVVVVVVGGGGDRGVGKWKEALCKEAGIEGEDA